MKLLSLLTAVTGPSCFSVQFIRGPTYSTSLLEFGQYEHYAYLWRNNGLLCTFK